MAKVIVYKSCGEMFYEAESDIWLVWGGFGRFLGCFGAEICFISFQYFKATTQWRPKSVYFTLYSKRPHDFEKITLGLGAMSTNAS